MIEDLQRNLKTLIAAFESQRTRAEKLSAELEKNKKSLEAAQVKINELEEKVDSLSLRSVFTSSEPSSAEAKAKIDSLIREIDEAIALLQ